jgi:hypothetical protein
MKLSLNELQYKLELQRYDQNKDCGDCGYCAYCKGSDENDMPCAEAYIARCIAANRGRALKGRVQNER